MEIDALRSLRHYMALSRDDVVLIKNVSLLKGYNAIKLMRKFQTKARKAQPKQAVKKLTDVQVATDGETDIGYEQFQRSLKTFYRASA